MNKCNNNDGEKIQSQGPSFWIKWATINQYYCRLKLCEQCWFKSIFTWLCGMLQEALSHAYCQPSKILILNFPKKYKAIFFRNLWPAFLLVQSNGNEISSSMVISKNAFMRLHLLVGISLISFIRRDDNHAGFVLKTKDLADLTRDTFLVGGIAFQFTRQEKKNLKCNGLHYYGHR